MRGMKSEKLTIGICGLASIGLLFAAQGCSSSSTTGGSGGSGGGATGSQGGKTGGLGGITGGGVGGAGVDAGPPLCTGVALAGAPLISDFSDVTPPEAGTTLTIPNKGGVSGYGGVTTTVAGGKLVVSGTVAAGVYAGASIYFNDCIDATAYTGVMFTLTGDFGSCDMLKFAANFPQIEPLPPASGHGVCVPPVPTASNCYGPGSPYTTATVMVTFASMTGGGAVATITPDAKNRLTGLGFGFHGPAAADGSAGGCAVNFTVDDLTFY
jgi:hypothetical protein